MSWGVRRVWVHAIVDDRERNVLKSKYLLSVVICDKSTVHFADAKLERIPGSAALQKMHQEYSAVRAALEETAAHHVVELALERIEAADYAGDFVVEMVLVPDPATSVAATFRL